jgi:hypothetical protein
VLQNLHHCLLDESVERSWTAEFANPSSVRLRDFQSYAGFWVMRRSGGAICRRFDDVDAVFESDTSDDFRQLICSIQAPPSF